MRRHGNLPGKVIWSKKPFSVLSYITKERRDLTLPEVIRTFALHVLKDIIVMCLSDACRAVTDGVLINFHLAVSLHLDARINGLINI